MTPAEDTALAAQLQLAADHGLPALVHTPHRDKLAGLRRTLDVVRESALAPERVAARPPQRDHREGGHGQRLLARLLRLPRHQDGRGPHGRGSCGSTAPTGPGQLRRRLGQERPAQDPQGRRRDAHGRTSTRTTSTRCCGATPSPSTGRAAASSLDLDRHTERHSTRATPSCAAGKSVSESRHALPPPRRLHRPPRLLHQRAPRRDPRRRPRPAARPLRARTQAPRPRPPRHRALARQGRRPRPDRRPRRAARACAPNSTAAASKSSPSTASRTRASAPRRSSTASTGRTGPTPNGWTTPPTWPGCSPRCSPTTSTEGTISTLPLAWRTAVRPPSRAGTHRPRGARHPRRAAGRPRGAHRPLHPRSAWNPSPAAPSRPPPTPSAPLTAIGHDRIGICVDTCHLATSFEDPRRARPRSPRPGSPSSSPSSPPPCTPNTPICPRSARRCAAFAEPRFLHQTRTRTAAGLRGTDDLDEALAGEARCPTAAPWRVPLPRPAARAARSRRSPPPSRAPARPARLVGGPAPRHPPPGGGDVHLAGAARPSCARAPAPSSPTASPPNSPSPATC